MKPRKTILSHDALPTAGMAAAYLVESALNVCISPLARSLAEDPYWRTVYYDAMGAGIRRINQNLESLLHRIHGLEVWEYQLQKPDDQAIPKDFLELYWAIRVQASLALEIYEVSLTVSSRGDMIFTIEDVSPFKDTVKAGTGA